MCYRDSIRKQQEWDAIEARLEAAHTAWLAKKYLADQQRCAKCGHSKDVHQRYVRNLTCCYCCECVRFEIKEEVK